MIIVITGPTCLGKSETAVKIAQKFNAEIINGDAFQSYKELNIGVAKPSEQQLKSVPHHLYSFLEPTHEYSIMEYQRILRDKINEVYERGKNVIIVGGSGLYIRAALYDYEFKEESDNCNDNYNELSNEDLHSMLERIDPIEAKKIHVNNRKRIIRALDIYENQHIRKSDLIASQKHKPIYKNIYFFVRDLDRNILYKRINERVDMMIEDGLLNEVKCLFEKYGDKLKSLQAIGYKELFPVIKNEISLEEGVELVKKNTRNYAKRQMTFIRHQFTTIFYKDTDDLINIIKEINH